MYPACPSLTNTAGAPGGKTNKQTNKTQNTNYRGTRD
jgi:hypothetical protein